MTEMGGFFTSISIAGPGVADHGLGAGDWRRVNLRGRTLGWIGLIALLQEMFHAVSK